MHHEFEWPKPENKREDDTLRHVREYGCSIINVTLDWHKKEQRFSRDLLFSYSVGLFANYDHPELIVFGLPAKQAMTVINVVRDLVADGQKFADGEISDEILSADYKVCFWQVPSAAYPSYLERALWFYGKCPSAFPCLRSSGRTSIGSFPGKRNAIPMWSWTSRC